MTTPELVGFGSAAVLAASAFMVLRPLWFFGRKLSLEETLSVGWVAWSILMAGFVARLLKKRTERLNAICALRSRL
jgi:uncharacterized membrane protein (GlpM family)